MRNGICALMGVLLSVWTATAQSPPKPPSDEIFSFVKIRSLNHVRGRLDNGLDPNLKNNDQFNRDTLLWYAVRNGAPETVNLLLMRGAKVDARDDSFDKTALFQAAFQGNVEIARILIKHGADVNALDDE